MLTVKNWLSVRLPGIVLAVIVLQPLMDVLSYFLGEWGSNTFSTLLRVAFMGLVALLGFLVTDKKKLYILFYGLAAAFWAAHVANCYRIGYQSVVQDSANFLRIVSFLVFLLSFLTFLRKGDGVVKSIYLGFGLNFGLFLLFTAAPWLTGHPIYTYDTLFVGVMGWFSIPNAQSTILVMAAPLALFWAYRTGKWPVFLLASLLCFGLLFATGTKLTFYSIFIIGGAYIFLFVLQLQKQSVKFALPLLLLLAAAFLFRHQSPMALREQMSAYSRGLYDQMVEETLKSTGTDEEVIKTIQRGVNRKQTNERTLEEIHRGLISVYTSQDTYGEFLHDMNQRFGVYRVMDAYNYSASSGILSDFRVMKSLFSRMVWEEKDLCTRFLGYEYNEVVVGDTIYDLENDFPAVYYFFGYTGFGLYLLVFAYIVVAVLRAYFLDVRACYGTLPARAGWGWILRVLGALGQGLRRFLTVEMGAVGMSFLLAVIAAQISGYVLRRPNVTIYFAISAACLLYLCTYKRGEGSQEGKGLRSMPKNTQ